MQDEPSGLPRATVLEALREHWRLDVRELTYAPVGFGSYHWHAVDEEGRRWFVTANGLSDNAIFDSPDGEANLLGLRAAFQASLELHEAGLEFVVAPLRSAGGEAVVAVAPDWGLSLFPHVEGIAGAGGVWSSEHQRLDAARLVARLHCTRPPRSLQGWDASVPYRGGLEAALREAGAAWSTGPYAEACREQLAGNAAVVRAALARYDALSGVVIAQGVDRVVSHGEPHASNFMLAAGGSTLHLIDWDTLRLAPRERDLCVIAGDAPAVLDAYLEVAGAVTLLPDAMSLFELRWPLADLALYVRRFRHPHTGGEDDAKSWRGVESSIRELSLLI